MLMMNSVTGDVYAADLFQDAKTANDKLQGLWACSSYSSTCRCPDTLRCNDVTGFTERVLTNSVHRGVDGGGGGVGYCIVHSRISP